MSLYVHGDNLHKKQNPKTEKDKKKYGDAKSKKYLAEIKKQYDSWKKQNEGIKGPLKVVSEKDDSLIEERVKAFNEYKNFIDQQKYAEKFDSRSNLHSSALEEFMYYLFKDLAMDHSQTALIGKCRAFKDLTFVADNYGKMLSVPGTLLETKDYDFVIGASVVAEFKCKGADKGIAETFDMPAVAIECKTYLDKTMLEACGKTGEQLKKNNPNALYIVVAERLKLSEAVNLKNYKIDQIYILRKQKNTDREDRFDDDYEANPIYADVVQHLFGTVREYLSADWGGKIADGLAKGYLI